MAVTQLATRSTLTLEHRASVAFFAVAIPLLLISAQIIEEAPKRWMANRVGAVGLVTFFMGMTFFFLSFGPWIGGTFFFAAFGTFAVFMFTDLGS